MTIKDIAKTCGVGISTVSRVLNGRPDVSDEVRSKVLAVVEETGYIPNNSARDLSRSHSDAIGVVVRGSDNLFFSAVLKSISSEIDKFGYTMVPHFITSDADEVKAGAILEREKKLRGLIFLGGRFDYTKEELALVNVPYVCCSFNNSFGTLEDSDYSSVSIDDYQTAYDAAEYLMKKGHRKIAGVVPGKDDHSISELRYVGYKDALEDAGIRHNDNLVEETGGSFEMPAAYDAVKRLLARTHDFTALCVPSDTMAIAAMKAIADEGLRVPEDISIIAIDGLTVSEYTLPTLTTMVQPAERMGRHAVSVLHDVLRGKETRHELLKAAVREGGSVREI